MLVGLSNRVPTGEELDRAERAVWKSRGPVEELEMSLRRVATHGRTVAVDSQLPVELAEPLTAEQAWNLTYFAYGVEAAAADTVEWAREIRTHVRGIYQDTVDEAAFLDRQARNGSDDA